MSYIDISELDVNNIVSKPVEIKKVSSNQSVTFKILPIRYNYGKTNSYLNIELPELCAYEGIKKAEFGDKTNYSYSCRLYPEINEHAVVISKMKEFYDRLCDLVLQNRKDLGISSSYKKELLPTIMKELIYMPKDKETGEYAPEKPHYINIKLQDSSRFLNLDRKVIEKEELFNQQFNHVTLLSVTGIMLVSGKLYIKMICKSSIIFNIESIKPYFPQMKTLEKLRKENENKTKNIIVEEMAIFDE